MDDLIEKLCAAPEGSRDLDCEIALAAGWTYEKRSNDRKPWWRRFGDKYGSSSRNNSCWPADRFSTYIDAKLPWENILCVMSPEISQTGKWYAECLCEDDVNCCSAEAATEPLARRAAALKARTHN